LVDKLQEDEVVKACGSHGGEEKHIQGFGVEKPEEQKHLEDRGTDGRILSK
jgi:hypothetical protein